MNIVRREEEKGVNPNERIITALDVPCMERAATMVRGLLPHFRNFKIGKELFTKEGPEAIRYVRNRGGDVFLDLKFHDTPNTVYGAVRAAVTHEVKMLSVHCLGGAEMMKAAMKAVLEGTGRNAFRPLVIGVTLLTSMNYKSLVEIGIAEDSNIADPEEKWRRETDFIERLAVRKLAWLARECGLDGIVASPQETRAIREYLGNDILIIAPGIRPAGSKVDDQKRTGTASEAIRDGANYLVIGRPITDAKSPRDSALRIAEEIASVS